MEKELEKHQRKRENLFNRMEEVKPEQVNLVRFVDAQWEVMEVDEDGKWHHTGRDHGQGLQVENRVYMVKGPYKMVNRRTFRITKVYDGIPEWATEELKERYRREWTVRGLDKRQTPPSGTAQQSPQLSAKALELLAALQSFPENWEHSISSLKACAHAGSRTVHKCIDELENAGFLIKRQGGNGHTVYTLPGNQLTQLSTKIGQTNGEEDDLPPW